MNAHIPDSILRIARAMRDQDNRATANPVWQIRFKKRIYGFDPDFAEGIAWRRRDSWDSYEASEDLHVALEEKYNETGEADEMWERVGYRDVTQIHAQFLTEDGLNNYVEINGHNIPSGWWSYVDCAFRNEEHANLRGFLIGLVANEQKEDA